MRASTLQQSHSLFGNPRFHLVVNLKKIIGLEDFKNVVFGVFVKPNFESKIAIGAKTKKHCLDVVSIKDV